MVVVVRTGRWSGHRGESANTLLAVYGCVRVLSRAERARTLGEPVDEAGERQMTM